MGSDRLNIEEYAWNKHKQQIVDNNELRNQLEETLEKLPQKFLA